MVDEVGNGEGGIDEVRVKRGLDALWPVRREDGGDGEVRVSY